MTPTSSGPRFEAVRDVIFRAYTKGRISFSRYDDGSEESFLAQEILTALDALPDSGLDVERLGRAYVSAANRNDNFRGLGWLPIGKLIAAAYARQPEPGEER
jgi:hypothetical protein